MQDRENRFRSVFYSCFIRGSPAPITLSVPQRAITRPLPEGEEFLLGRGAAARGS